MPQGILHKFSDWMARHTTATGAFSTRAVRKDRGTAMPHWQPRSMTEAIRASPPARRRPVMLVMSKALAGIISARMAHMTAAIWRERPSRWNRGNT